MTQFRVMLDPTLPAREAGRIQGATEMRERIKHDFATYATRHPDPVVADELWGFVHFIERIQP